jgi:hypothetical protein
MVRRVVRERDYFVELGCWPVAILEVPDRSDMVARIAADLDRSRITVALPLIGDYDGGATRIHTTRRARIAFIVWGKETRFGLPTAVVVDPLRPKRCG